VGDAASATWSATDSGSGLAGPATGSLPLDTSRAGTFTARYEAADVAGHRTPATCQYVVQAAPEPGPEPTATPTASPTATPTASPAATPTATPAPETTAFAGSGTGTPAQQGGPAVEAGGVGTPLAVRAPAPSLRGVSRVAAGGRVRITLRCLAACSGRLSLRAKDRTLAARRFSALAGRFTLALRLSRRDRRTLARRHRLRVRVVLSHSGGDATARSVILRAR
jgi:hypothetical protein